MILHEKLNEKRKNPLKNREDNQLVTDMPDSSSKQNGGGSLLWSREKPRSRETTPSARGPATGPGPRFFTFDDEDIRGDSPSPEHNHEILQMMAKVLRKFEEVASKHAERLRFLDPELESTNTRIEVLESICKANDDRFVDFVESMDLDRLRHIVKIKESSTIRTMMTKTDLREKKETLKICTPIHGLQQEDLVDDDGHFNVFGEDNISIGNSDEGFFQTYHTPTNDCKIRESVKFFYPS